METCILTVGTPSHDRLRVEQFEPALQRCEPVHWIHHQRPSGSNPKGDFGCGDWLEVMMFKYTSILRTCRSLNSDTNIIISDLDITYMPTAFIELAKYAQQGMYAMCEDEEAQLNAGLLVSANTRELHWLLHHCIAYMATHRDKHDQDALRACGKDSVKTLPVTFANTKTEHLTTPADMLCFHAICTRADDDEGSIDKKLRMLSERC
jgi:hypothetical protein